MDVSTTSTILKSRISESSESNSMQPFIQHDSEALQEADYLKSLESRVKQLELENLDLKRKLWKLKLRGRRTIGIMLTSIGGAALVGSYVFSSLILTFIGMGLTLWGAVVFYILPSRQVPEKIITALTLQVKTLDDILVSVGCRGSPIFYNTHHGNSWRSYIFVPYDSVYKVPEGHESVQEKIFHDISTGISVGAPFQGLAGLFESELNIDFTNVDLDYVQESLSELLVEDLNLIDDLFVENNNGIIHVRMVGKACAQNCELMNKQTHLGYSLGCSLCGVFAIIISKVTGKPVTIQDTVVSDDSIETSYVMVKS